MVCFTLSILAVDFWVLLVSLRGLLIGLVGLMFYLVIGGLGFGVLLDAVRLCLLMRIIMELT